MSFSDWIVQEAGKVENVLLVSIAVAAIACVFAVYVRTKAFIATLGAMVLAGGVVWGANSVDWFQEKFENEANQNGMGAVVHVVETPAGASG